MNYANENIFDEIVAGQSEYLLRIAYLYVKDWQVAELLSLSDNTVKTRLNQKMGDTKNRANHLIAKINNKKRQSNRNKKSPSRIPYFLTLGSFAVLMALFFLMNPFDLYQENTSDDPTLVADELKSYFRQSGDVAYYIGRGMEYASYQLETIGLDENYVQTIKVNDGTALQFIYRITEDEIQLVYNGSAEQNTTQFELTELDQLPIISVVLKTPLENGETFDGKTVSFPETVDTPIGSFENAMKVSEKFAGATIHTYYVPNEGIVKADTENHTHETIAEWVKLDNRPMKELIITVQ